LENIWTEFYDNLYLPDKMRRWFQGSW